MTVVDRVAERALALGASGACDEDAVADLQRLAQGNQLALEAARSLVWLGGCRDPDCQCLADELLTRAVSRSRRRPTGASRAGR